jgi:hypothetical protein
VNGDLVPRPATPEPGGPVATELVQPGTRALARSRWELRALQFRAADLAEAVFGEPAVARILGGRTGRVNGLRGLLELEVPFRDMAEHHAAEARFLAACAADEVLGSSVLVIVFTPRVPAT